MATEVRSIEGVWQAQPTLEGAGVHLHRAFGNNVVPRLDPFLLLDDLRSDNPVEFAPGFPWHPHRGIETITYMLEGRVEHGDSLGNKGIVAAGDVQWLTAGSGIIHQEMPKPVDGRMGGFQLWLNIPREHKMMHPHYQEFSAAAIPVHETKATRVRVVAGSHEGVDGPVKYLRVAPTFLDVTVKAGQRLQIPLPKGHRAFAYTLEGRGGFGDERIERYARNHLVVFADGDGVLAHAAQDQPFRFLLAAGKPLNEPVAWWGPIVMNTKREIETALMEFQEGTFIKHKAPTTAF